MLHPARAGRGMVEHRRLARSRLTPAAELAGFFVSLMGPSYRYTEELILPEESLRVLGSFNPSTAPPADPTVNERLRQVKADPTALLARFDADRDGQISVEEWDAARKVVVEDEPAPGLRAPAGPIVHTITLSPNRAPSSSPPLPRTL